jgi:hypothetical protein
MTLAMLANRSHRPVEMKHERTVLPAQIIRAFDAVTSVIEVEPAAIFPNRIANASMIPIGTETMAIPRIIGHSDLDAIVNRIA